MHRSQFFRVFRDIAAVAGLSPNKQHPHVLKHALATHLVAANVNLALVQTQLLDTGIRIDEALGLSFA